MLLPQPSLALNDANLSLLTREARALDNATPAELPKRAANFRRLLQQRKLSFEAVADLIELALVERHRAAVEADDEFGAGAIEHLLTHCRHAIGLRCALACDRALKKLRTGQKLSIVDRRNIADARRRALAAREA